MTALAVAGSLVSGVVGAFGTMQSANAEAAALNYNAAVNERNAATSLNQSEAEIKDQRRENRRQMSSIRNAYGASGFAMEGSPLDVLEDTAIEQELDVRKIDYQGRMRAQGYKEQSVIDRMGAKNVRKAGKIGAVAQLIGGAANAGQVLARN